MHRIGNRKRLLATPFGDIQLRIPRFRAGSFSPTLLEPRRRVDRALWAVVMEAYVSGVSTRKVDELVAALGCESCISKQRSAASARASTCKCRPSWAGPSSSAASPISTSMRRTPHP